MAIKKRISIEVDSDDAEKKIGGFFSKLRIARDEIKTLFTSMVNEEKKAIKEAEALNNTLDETGEKAKKGGDNIIGGLSKSNPLISEINKKTGGLASAFIDVGRAAKLSGKAMKSALISSGIGLLFIVVSQIVDNWGKIVDFISGSNDELQDQIDLGNDIIDNLKFQSDILKIQKKTLENQGKSIKEIDKTIKETLKKQLLQEETLLKIEISQNNIELSKASEFTWWQKIKIASRGVLGTVELISEEEKKQQDEREKAIQERKKGIENIKLQLSSLAKQERDDTEKAIADAKRLNDEKFKQFLKDNKKAEDNIKQEDEKAKKERDYNAETQALLDEEEELKIEAENRRLENLQKFLEEEKALKTQAKERELLFEENVATSRLNIESNTLDLLSKISKKGSDLAKGVAIAEVVRNQVASVSGIISNTAQANAKAVALSPLTAGQPFVTLNTISAALGIAGSVAGGVSAIKDITSEKKSISGGGNANLSGGSRSVQAPSFNLVSGSGSNQIAEGLANQSRPLRAFVVSGDVSSAQEMDRNIIENSSL